MKNVAIVISGSGSNMVSLVASMTGEHPGRPCVVISNRPGAGGLARAADLGVPTEIVDHRAFGERVQFEDELDARLRAHGAEFLCLAGFMRILSESFVARWTGRCLNIHPSLLPKFRGLHTHARAIEAGEREHGCSVHEVTPELDGGPVLGQGRLLVSPSDTPETLATRVQRLEHQLYPAVLRRYVDGDRNPVRIDESSL